MDRINVINILSVSCAPEAIATIGIELGNIFRDLKSGSQFGEADTIFSPDPLEDGYLVFSSDWQPDHLLQDALTKRLGQIDSSVVIKNRYYREGRDFAGVRATALLGAQIVASERCYKVPDSYDLMWEIIHECREEVEKTLLEVDWKSKKQIEDLEPYFLFGDNPPLAG